MKKAPVLFLLLCCFFGCAIAQECPSPNTTVPGQITLEYAVNRALTANRKILSAYNSLQSTKLKLELAYSEFDLKMKPLSKVGYSGGGYEGDGTDLGIGIIWDKKSVNGAKLRLSPYVRKLEKQTSIDIDAEITQPLFRGFNREYNLASLRSAQHSARTAIRSLHMAQVGMVLKTIKLLYKIIKLENYLAVNKESYQSLQTLYKIIKYKEDWELTEDSELSKVDTELEKSEEAIESCEDKIKESYEELSELLVLKLDSCVQIATPLAFQNCPLDCAQAIEIAQQHRPEIEQACEDYSEKCRQTRVTKENLKPHLDLVVKYNNTGYDRYFRDIDKKPKVRWTIGLSTTSEYGRLSETISYDQALLAQENACFNVDQAKEKVQLEVKHALSNLESASESIESKQKKLISLKGELKLLQRKYAKGKAKTSDLIKTEKSITSAKIDLFAATIDYIVGEYTLKAATGLLIEKPIV